MKNETLIDELIDKAPAKNFPAPTSPGKGNRICRNCGKPTASRSDACKHCGQKKSDGIDPDRKAFQSLDQIDSLGGLESIKEKIALVKKINEETLQPLGGLEEAERLVVAVEALFARVQRSFG
ncbi:MAG: hypothetical protein ACYC3X_20660 [Pirellulaceae bacterium]|jgi:hypothetical protein